MSKNKQSNSPMMDALYLELAARSTVLTPREKLLKSLVGRLNAKNRRLMTDKRSVLADELPNLKGIINSLYEEASKAGKDAPTEDDVYEALQATIIKTVEIFMPSEKAIDLLLGQSDHEEPEEV
mgnify:CR=1 FL=1